MSKHVCAIGSTGTGKSTLCNLLAGENFFPVSDNISSCTYQTTVKPVNWRGSGEAFALIDTPGLGDADGRDSQNIAAMVDKLKDLHHVNAFLIVFNSQNPRLDEHLRAMLNIFANIFGKDFFSNVILVFTRWEYDDKSERKRNQAGISKESRRLEFNRYLQETFSITQQPPAVFLDNYPDWDDWSEKLHMEEELDQLKAHVFSMSAFLCQDAQAVRGQIDALRQAAEEERRRKEQAEAEAQRRAAEAEAERQQREEDARRHAEQLQREQEENRRREAELERQRQEAARKAEADRIAHQQHLEELARRARRKRKRGFLGIRL